MSKTLQIFVGIVLIILVPFWIFVVSPEILKLPANTSYKATLIHAENNRFDINSSWTGKTIAISSSNIKTFVSVENKSDIQSLFKVESLTGETLFELNQDFVVDRQTRYNLPGGKDTNGKSSILFAPNVSQKEISFWPVDMGAPVVMKYVGKKAIQKIDTYHFSSKGSIIDDTLGYQFLPFVPEKYRVLSKVNIDIYVEPVTGTIIDHQDSGVSYYSDKDGKPVWDIAEWSNKYNDPTISSRVQEAKSKITYYIIVSRVVPISLTLLGIFLVIIPIFKKRKNPKKQ